MVWSIDLYIKGVERPDLIDSSYMTNTTGRVGCILIVYADRNIGAQLLVLYDNAIVTLIRGEEFMFSDEFICTRHIFLQHDTGDDIEANRALAEEAYAKYQSGTPMDALMGSKYNEDVTLSAKPALSFTRGEYDKEYEDAAFALRVGQVSGIVETEDGFYIIERCEKSSSYMLGNFEAFAQQITYALVNQRVEAKQSTLSLEMNEFGSSLDLVKIAVDGDRAKGESK